MAILFLSRFTNRRSNTELDCVQHALLASEILTGLTCSASLIYTGLMAYSKDTKTNPLITAGLWISFLICALAMCAAHCITRQMNSNTHTRIAAGIAGGINTI